MFSLMEHGRAILDFGMLATQLLGIIDINSVVFYNSTRGQRHLIEFSWHNLISEMNWSLLDRTDRDHYLCKAHMVHQTF